jgi:large subunit ribosomal protein L9
MKVILLQDISGVGRKYDVKNVADGYAVNFLLPKKMAAAATDQVIKSSEKNKAEAEAERQVQENLMEKTLESMAGGKIVIQEKANEAGHLFAKIHKKEVAKAIKEQLHAEIPEEYIELDEHIKSTGTHKIPLNYKGKKVEVELEVAAK